MDQKSKRNFVGELRLILFATGAAFCVFFVALLLLWTAGQQRYDPLPGDYIPYDGPPMVWTVAQ